MVALGDPTLQHDTGVLAQADRQIEPRQGLLQRPARQHPAGLQHHQVVGQARDLVGGVADIEDGDGQALMQPLQVRQDLLLALVVQGGQGLVHQQDSRVDRERPGDADALALAAGQALRATLQQRADP